MVLCPVALAVGCRKCPVFAVCPLKSTIGDYSPERVPTPRAAAPGDAVAKTVKKAAKQAVKATTRGGESRRRSSKRRPQ
jgi:hypothetical protein